MSREQTTVQQQSDSISPEPAREISAEQPTHIGGRVRHEVLPSNREGDLTTSNIQAQGNKRKMSQVDADQGMYNKLNGFFFHLPKSKRATMPVVTVTRCSQEGKSISNREKNSLASVVACLWIWRDCA